MWGEQCAGTVDIAKHIQDTDEHIKDTDIHTRCGGEVRWKSGYLDVDVWTKQQKLTDVGGTVRWKSGYLDLSDSSDAVAPTLVTGTCIG
jgi:hypothetical protein